MSEPERLKRGTPEGDWAHAVVNCPKCAKGPNLCAKHEKQRRALPRVKR